MAIVQLHHAGNRAPAELIGTTPVCPSDDPDTGARALTDAEVQAVIADFVAGAVRSERAGFDGVELHGAHGYLICQFLSSELNRRTDEYGGSLENRSRLLFEIIDGIRAACDDDFIVCVRLSPERFGMQLGEIRVVTQQLIDSGLVDFIDLSLWDCFKRPEEAEWKGRTLTEVATDIERRTDPSGRRVPLAVAGKIHDPADAERGARPRRRRRGTRASGHPAPRLPATTGARSRVHPESCAGQPRVPRRRGVVRGVHRLHVGMEGFVAD
ncbi:MAG: hypothetical protein R2710_03290 [Acidimicrobiales bacterium]